MKSMKKIVAIVLAALLVVAVFAGCSKKDGGETTTATTAKAEDTTTIPADFKVGFIFLHDENSTYDLNFINAAKEACKELGIADENIIMKTGIDESNACYDTAMDLVDQGCKFIFADSFGHEPFMIQAAKEATDVQFFHATGTKAHTEKLPNYHNAFASIYEGRYLAGIAAGMKLNELKDAGKLKGETAKMGYVGAFPYAEVKSGYTSLFLGAKSVCPEVTMEVTFTNSWYDEAAEKDAANNLIARKCDLISQHADSMGAPTACENAGIPNVSYNGSTVEACPNTFIVSSKINWAPYMKLAITNTVAGKTTEADWTGTLETESVQLTEINEKAAAKGTQEAIDAAKAELIAGTRHVYDVKNFTVTVDKDKNVNAKVDDKGNLTSYTADVDDMGDFKGDTEVVKDGYFHESEFRSAPYFDIDIDGITIL